MDQAQATQDVGYLQDDGGNKSSIRLMSILALLFGFLVAGFQIYTNRVVTIELFYASMVAAFCPKVVQKLVEMKFSKNGNGG